MKKYMPERNPYIIGPPVEEPHQFFGRQLLLKNIKDSLQRKRKFILLSGQRRIGKSSVLRNIPLFVNDEEFLFVHCDLQVCSHSNIGEILYAIAHEVFLHFQLKRSILKPLLNADLEIICQIFNNGLLPKIVDVLKNKKLVLLLDEFDVVSQNNPEQAVQFLGFLENLIKQKEELFVIAVVGRYINSMPNLLQSFQGALFYEIGLLDDNDAQRLITEPAQNFLQYQEKTIAEILKFSSGHPYYTQVLCYEIFNLLGRNKKNLTNPTILPHHVGIVVPKAIESAEGGLGGFWEGLSVIERVVISAVAEAQQQNPPQDPLTLLEDYELEPTDSLEETIQILINKGFLDSSPMKIKVELVRYWLVKCHQFRDEIRKEFSNLE